MVLQSPSLPEASPSLKLTVWGINYHPEPTGIAPYNTDLCEYLKERGHEVRMISSFRYYPHWEKLPSDQRRLFRTDTIRQVPVHRCWCFVPKRLTALKRILHELSFCLFSTLRVLALPRPDVLVVVSPPLALGFFAWLASRLKRTRFIFHVQDLQPDAALGLGMLKPSLFTRALYALEAFAYKKAEKVSSIAPGILQAFRDKGVPEAKCLLVPNWLRSAPKDHAAVPGVRRVLAKHGLEEKSLLALYSGNIGKKQNIGILLEAARLLHKSKGQATPQITLVLAGDGAGRAELESALKQAPCPALKLLPLLDDQDYHDMLGAVDLCLITQAPGTGQHFFPSKLLSALCARVPVIAVADADSELSRAVFEGGFGAVVPPDSAQLLATHLEQLALNPEQLQTWKARTVWVDQFARERILGQFEKTLQSLAQTQA